MDSLRNRFHVNFLGYAHWFLSIVISYIKEHYILVYQARYATSTVVEYLNTVTVNTSTTFYKFTLPSDIILTKAGASISYDQVEKLAR